MRKLWKLGIVCMSTLMAEQDVAQKADKAALQVFLFDYEEVPPRVLRDATAAASAIFERAGVNIEWFECAPRTVQLSGVPCREITSLDIQVRILNTRMAKRAGMSRHSVGYAIPASGSVAAVYYHRAQELEKKQFGSLSLILGAAMAHEMGHLLLARPGHSSVGLMRAEWDKADLAALKKGGLNFRESEVQRIASTMEETRSRRAAAARIPKVDSYPTPVR